MTTRILVISHNYIRFTGDHAGLFVHTLNKALAEKGFTVSVVAPHDPGAGRTEHIDGIRIRRFRYAPDSMENITYRGTMHELVRGSLGGVILFMAFSIAFLLSSAAEVLRGRPHLLHAHWWFPAGLLAWLLSLLSGIPYVITVHGTDAQVAGGNALFSYLCGRILSGAQAVMVSSDYLLSTLKANLSSMHFRQIRLFKIPVPVEPFSGQESMDGRESDPNSILTVGRLTEQKNTGVLIDALAILQEEKTPFHAVIVGDGPQRSEIERRISEKGLPDRVTLKMPGGRNELAREFASCGIFVLPSIREGLGLVLVEALLMKRPVAASRNGGTTEIVEDGVTGLLFDPHDPRDLAEKLSRLLRDRNLAEELASRGYEQVRSRFSPAYAAKLQADIYHSALGMPNDDVPQTRPAPERENREDPRHHPDLQ